MRPTSSASSSVVIEPSTSKSSFLIYRDPASTKTSGRVVKAKAARKERQQTNETMGKLKELVPTVPRGEQVSKIELLQHVIDYIFELQRQLADDETAMDVREP